MSTRVQELLEGSLFRDGYWLSPNARLQLVEMNDPKWRKVFALADKIEDGRASVDDAELDVLYEMFPTVVDTMIDLFNMVSRRDETYQTMMDDAQGDAFDRDIQS